MWQTALAGFSIGMVSSLHCVGMCGPLALSLPVHHLRRGERLLAILLYNSGRIITYTSMGLLAGSIGRGFSLAGVQQWLSVGTGTLVLLLTLRVLLPGRGGKLAVPQGAYYRMQQWAARSLRPRSLVAYVVPGLVNGLLPCGMVYLALAAAVSARQVGNSITIMFFFGLGTLPAMLSLGFFGLTMGLPARRLFRKATPWLAIGIALVLILRGLDLGIPYISPRLANGISVAISCHP